GRTIPTNAPVLSPWRGVPRLPSFLYRHVRPGPRPFLSPLPRSRGDNRPHQSKRDQSTWNEQAWRRRQGRQVGQSEGLRPIGARPRTEAPQDGTPGTLAVAGPDAGGSPRLQQLVPRRRSSLAGATGPVRLPSTVLPQPRPRFLRPRSRSARLGQPGRRPRLRTVAR